jgi:hypothetical protein
VLHGPGQRHQHLYEVAADNDETTVAIGNADAPCKVRLMCMAKAAALRHAAALERLFFDSHSLIKSMTDDLGGRSVKRGGGNNRFEFF